MNASQLFPRIQGNLITNDLVGPLECPASQKKRLPPLWKLPKFNSSSPWKMMLPLARLSPDFSLLGDSGHKLQGRSRQKNFRLAYCWWKKSCTTRHVWNPVNDGIFTISTGEFTGFLNHQQYLLTLPSHPATQRPRLKRQTCARHRARWRDCRSHCRRWAAKASRCHRWSAS